MNGTLRRVLHVPAEAAGKRLDQCLAELLPEYSRNLLKGWILEGAIRVDGASARPRDRLKGGERVELDVQPQRDEGWTAEDITLHVVHEDADLVVIDKPAGLVVHPGAGNRSGTLLNALLHRYPELAAIPRAGIVHRLDKDTSGLLVVARSLRAHTSLVGQLLQRSMGREYLAVVIGCPTAGGTIDAPIARHRVHRTRMAVVPGGRRAVTHYRVVERYRGHALLRCKLETGRTHQIRVHMAHAGFPLLGDPAYAGRPRPPAGAGQRLRAALDTFKRQALHAEALELEHPSTGRRLRFESRLPPDFATLVEALRADIETDPTGEE